MAWIEDVNARVPAGLTWKNGDQRQFITLGKSPLVFGDKQVIDTTLVERSDADFDGWQVVSLPWHFRLGRPVEKKEDGWLSTGSQEGKDWIHTRLVKLGYLHLPTGDWQDVGGDPTYARDQVSSVTSDVALGPDEASVVARPSSVVSWHNIWDFGGAETYVTWRINGHSIKENVVLTQKARNWVDANAPAKTPPEETCFGVVFALDLADVESILKANVPQDLDMKFSDDGATKLELKNADNETIAIFPPSTALGKDPLVPISLRKEIWKNPEGGLFMFIGADLPTLATLPDGDVLFDPTTDFQPTTTGQDVYLYSASPTTNFGGSASIYARSNDLRSLIKFDISSIPATATVDSASLLLVDGGSNTAQTITFNPILSGAAAWTESTATWNKIDGTNAWASVGCNGAGTDYNVTNMGTFTANSTPGESTCTLSTSAVQAWVSNSANNFGMVMSAATSDASSYSTSEESGKEPKLSITYTEATILAPLMFHQLQQQGIA